MIPKVTQDGPNIAERYWCAKCGRGLLREGKFLNIEGYLCCPGCGEQIEWDKAVPVKWAPVSCDTCGNPMIIEIDGRMVSTGSYVGTTTCRECMAEYCTATNCLGCRRGHHPGCKWQYLKRKTVVEDDV